MDTAQFNIVSFCSGAGMLDHGVRDALRRKGFRPRVLAYGERESAPCAALLARMEEKTLDSAPIWCGDLESFPAKEFHGMVDGVGAGFPCQPHSTAGKKLGRHDERNILPAILRIADEMGAWCLFLENVIGLKKEFDYIAGVLLSFGWHLEWGTLRASDVGAGHRRDRWFCVAVKHSLAGPVREPKPGELPAGEGGDHVAHGGRGGGERRGNREGVAQPVATPASQPRHGHSAMPDPRGHGMGHGLPAFAPGPTDPSWNRILRTFPFLAPALPIRALSTIGNRMVTEGNVDAEPIVQRVADGLASVLVQSRYDMLRIAGNGVVPQQAAEAYTQLLSRILHD